MLRRAIAARAFPGAVAFFSRGDAVLWHGAAGTLGYEAPFRSPATLGTLYDLASLTKLYTLAASLLVFRAAGVALEAPLRRFWPAFDPRISIESLMTHSSGLVFPLQGLHLVAANEWVSRLANAPRGVWGEVVYCCSNYFLLARAAEAVSGASLDDIIARHILAPLQLDITTFAPRDLRTVAPTEAHSGGIWRGLVHDEAARSWREQTGTCAGNAGLFAPASEVARFAQLWTGDAEGLHPDDVARALQTRRPERSYWRGLGFQFDAPFYMSEAAPRATAGHLGFTGPSLVLHRETRRIAVILNNRVHPARSGPDRLPFHRQIMAQFFEAS